MPIEPRRPTAIGLSRRDLYEVRYIRFHGSKKHPVNMGKSEIEAFLSHLAVHEDVSASTQRQALNAIILLYRDVLDIPVEGEIEPVKAKRHRHLPDRQASSAPLRL